MTDQKRDAVQPLLVAMTLLSTVGLVGLIAILFTTDSTEKAVILAGILTAALTGVLATIMAGYAATAAREAAVLSQGNKQELQSLVIKVNGRMDQLIEAANKAGLITGHAEEKKDAAAAAAAASAAGEQSQVIDTLNR